MKTLDPNCQWALRLQSRIDSAQPVDEICSQSYQANWLITKLSRSGTNFKIYNLGAGVKRITTETENCPCCKKKL